MALYASLFSDGKTLHQIQAKAPSWRRFSGKDCKPEKPEIATLSKIRNRLRLEDMVLRLDGTTAKLEAAKEMLGPMAKAANQERLLDEVMTAISEEVIERTMERLNPGARTNAAKLLLKRADQRQVARRLDFLESRFKTVKPGKSASGDTPEEVERDVNQILGLPE